MFDTIRIIGINLAFSLLDRYLISVLPYEPIKLYLQSKLDFLKRAADKLTDKNPENEAQLKELWEQYEDEIVDDTLDTAIEIVLKEVKDPILAQFIAEALRQIRDSNGGQELPAEEIKARLAAIS